MEFLNTAGLINPRAFYDKRYNSRVCKEFISDRVFDIPSDIKYLSNIQGIIGMDDSTKGKY